MDNLEWYAPKRKRPLIILDGKRLRYVSFTAEFGYSRGCEISWTDKNDLAYSLYVTVLSNSPIVRRTGRWIILLSTRTSPRSWLLENVFARHEVAASE